VEVVITGMPSRHLLKNDSADASAIWFCFTHELAARYSIKPVGEHTPWGWEYQYEPLRK
jgi:hypothetical protein